MLALLAPTLATLAIGSPANAASDTVRGFQIHPLTYEMSPDSIDRELDLAKGAGANVVRLDIAWSSIETGKKGDRSPWYVAKLDRLFTSARTRGIKVLATFWKTPCWASSAPASVKQDCQGDWWNRGVLNYPPNDPGDYGDAIGWLTSRYGPQLAAVELWNEPNFEGGTFFKASDPAAAYTAMVRGAYPRAKANGDASVPILAGAISKADRPFLDKLYANGIKGYEDGISVHPYNEGRDPDNVTWKDTLNTMQPGIDAIRGGIRAAGDPVGIWVTEFGWTTANGDNWHVDAATQAAYLAKAMTILGAMPDVHAAVAYELRDSGTDPNNHEFNFGLVSAAGVPKPAYAAVAAALAVAPTGGPAGNVSGAATIAPAKSAASGSSSNAGSASDKSSTAAASTPPPNAEAPPVKLSLAQTPTGQVMATVSAAPRVAVKVALSRCPIAITYSSRTNAKGRSDKRIGRIAKITGCRVTARTRRGTARAVVRRTLPKRR